MRHPQLFPPAGIRSRSWESWALLKPSTGSAAPGSTASPLSPTIDQRALQDGKGQFPEQNGQRQLWKASVGRAAGEPRKVSVGRSREWCEGPSGPAGVRAAPMQREGRSCVPRRGTLGIWASHSLLGCASSGCSSQQKCYSGGGGTGGRWKESLFYLWGEKGGGTSGRRFKQRLVGEKCDSWEHDGKRNHWPIFLRSFCPQMMNVINSVSMKFGVLIRFDRKTNSRTFC